MRCVKATAVGLLAACALTTVFIVARIGGPILYQRFVVVPRLEASGDWSWDTSAPIRTHWLEPFATAAIGFTLGVWWMLRRPA